MQVIRQYKNASGFDIRIDTILMERKQNTIGSSATTHTFIRNLKVNPVYNSSVSDRQVAEIEVIGDFTTIDTANFTWARWDSPTAILDMSDLPSIADIV